MPLVIVKLAFTSPLPDSRPPLWMLTAALLRWLPDSSSTAALDSMNTLVCVARLLPLRTRTVIGSEASDTCNSFVVAVGVSTRTVWARFVLGLLSYRFWIVIRFVSVGSAPVDQEL